MGFYEGKNVLVSGGAGFIGSHVVELLLSNGANVSVVTRKKDSKKTQSNLRASIKKINLLEADLINFQDCKNVVKGQDFVFNCASLVGSIEYSKAHADILRTNVLIELNLLEASRLNNIEKYLMLSSAEVYPKELNGFMKEEDSLLGEISDSKFGYGWSKRANEAAAKAYSKQYNMKIAIVRPSNVYGPRDNFFSGKELVVPAFIKNVFSNKNIEISGDGLQIRNFTYVKDCAKGMLLAMEKHCNADPINIATSEQTTVKELAEKIIAFSGKSVSINYDKKSSSGPKMVVLDTSKAKKLIGFKASVSLDKGLNETIDWFKETNQK